MRERNAERKNRRQVLMVRLNLSQQNRDETQTNFVTPRLALTPSGHQHTSAVLLCWTVTFQQRPRQMKNRKNLDNS